MIAEVVVAAELVGAVVALKAGPVRTFRSYRDASSSGSLSPPIVNVPPVVVQPPKGDVPPVVITPGKPPVVVPVNCKAKVDAYVASLPDMTRDIIREAIVIGNAMQIDALATAVEKDDPALAACLRAQKKA